LVCHQAKCGKAANVNRSDRSLDLIRHGYLFGPSVRAGAPAAADSVSNASAGNDPIVLLVSRVASLNLVV
jgi:hypothetical protein